MEEESETWYDRDTQAGKIPRLSDRQSTNIHQIREVAEGVQYIHSEGIVHGDLHGVSILISHCSSERFIPLRTRGISSSILIYTAKSLILD